MRSEKHILSGAHIFLFWQNRHIFCKNRRKNVCYFTWDAIDFLPELCYYIAYTVQVYAGKRLIGGMKMSSRFLMVDSKIVPEAYLKVLEAKAKIVSGKVGSVNDAIKSSGISRSTFYKYKDSIFACSELEKERLISLEFTVDDIQGVLSAILNVLNTEKASVLTINQNIPINDVANVNITFKQGNAEIDELMTLLKKIKGVNKVRVTAMS